ncbi:hypothetical protein [Brucella grignonensis]|uniref:Uncharacterized protein n=1 Tax=Brucella grignonensis TaxID=94627 RepID=A0A256F0S9_9HYPH|nr:hypothetical protein [Brucella grignonensis]OYR08498.1 hypothetical protein CEV33_3208 [Brucella grignonensis]
MSRFSLLSTLKLSLFNEVIWHNEKRRRSVERLVGTNPPSKTAVLSLSSA